MAKSSKNPLNSKITRNRVLIKRFIDTFHPNFSTYSDKYKTEMYKEIINLPYSIKDFFLILPAWNIKGIYELFDMCYKVANNESPNFLEDFREMMVDHYKNNLNRLIRRSIADKFWAVIDWLDNKIEKNSKTDQAHNKFVEDVKQINRRYKNSKLRAVNDPQEINKTVKSNNDGESDQDKDSGNGAKAGKRPDWVLNNKWTAVKIDGKDKNITGKPDNVKVRTLYLKYAILYFSDRQSFTGEEVQDKIEKSEGRSLIDTFYQALSQTAGKNVKYIYKNVFEHPKDDNGNEVKNCYRVVDKYKFTNTE